MTGVQTCALPIFVAQIGGQTNSYLDNNLTVLTNYYYEVRAKNPLEGAFSAEVCMKPFPWVAALGCLP